MNCITSATVFLVVDARCLQDPAFASRGVGQHAATLLAAGRACADVARRFHFVALTDPKLPPLERKYRALFAEIRTTAYLPNGPRGTAVFFSPSPMTHSPMPIARLLLQPGTFCAAVVLDFIPHDLPEQYLDDPAAHVAYTTALAWLARYDLFLPISAYSDRRLREILAIDPGQSRVTGVAVRRSLLPPNGSAPTTWSGRRPEIVVTGGEDARKNIEVALAAHASSPLLSAGVRMVVVGGYSEASKARLRRQYSTLGGQDGLLDFALHVDDAELRELYTRARLTIVPSRIEGFSIPIVEASANGCPVLAADCEAHAELLSDPADRFPPNDVDRLRQLAERIIFDARVHAAAQARQDGLWRRFLSDAVAGRVWEV